MQDLRLVGVHEGGEHLLLSGKGGETFRLRIDEALRVAASRPVHRSAPQAAPAAGTTMTPRDIQARIRSGASAEEVAELSGHDLAHIRRYEGPVLAEREYVARQAQGVEVAAPMSATHDGYRSAFGENPVNLGDMVLHRLRSFGVDPDSVEWDAWRRPDGTWEVVARFELTEKSRVAVGEEPPARWIFSPLRKSVTNTNRWAQVLSELEPLDTPVPTRRLAAVADRVFDFEAEGGASSDDTDDILEVLRSRRGQRLGSDEDGDDALATLLSKGSVPAAHPREGSPDTEDEDSNGKRPRTGRLTLAPSVDSADSDDPVDPVALPGSVTQTREISVLARPFRRRATREPAADGTDEETPNPPAEAETAVPDEAPVESPARKNAGRDFPWDRLPSGGKGQQPSDADKAEGKDDGAQERRAIKPKRSSVPSWDEIVFGTKGD
ncbi:MULTISPECIES: septation protein SepH [unclassified Arthrobacter]|uniref:septation protein SepH n=1 Tax=unclassified Arthrobacter TaxID=235627 RepID=UPI002107B76D|nr:MULTISPECIES: septation protein SepH [unclassified Arthrobacter]MCQ1987206.1 septation protein SepH [Arthrobacter sp. zg-Y844]MCQ1995869.1 septation protein SepH [Arthrobacter sp. zg-Y1171]UWX83052.1 septation protein SepH [Arthrobacter sp. zg-Y1171]